MKQLPYWGPQNLATNIQSLIARVTRRPECLQPCRCVVQIPLCTTVLHVKSVLQIPVWSSTVSSNYLKLQVVQSKCLRVVGNHSRRIPNSHLQNSLNIEPIPVPIHHLTDKYFTHCPLHPDPLVRQIGNYTLADLTNLYNKYKRNRTIAYTALISLPDVGDFFVHNFSLPLFAPIFTYLLFSSTCTKV
jgi:hypothetical protein